MKIFISYAHTSKETAKKLAERLRQEGLDVSIDLDVENLPPGPDGGWPLWMERQITESDWVLMLFDETYLRRFEGKEKPSSEGIGMGGTYEGQVIRNLINVNYARKTERFIPLLTRGVNIRGLPPLFGGTVYHVPKGVNTLVRRLTDSDEPPPVDPRQVTLSRLAYVFLRLDQLPTGGWGKTLPQWMEAIWEGDAGTITRSSEMREHGGTDFSCASYESYIQFIRNAGVGALVDGNEVDQHFLKSLQRRIDHDRGMNAGVEGRTVKPKYNIRHAAMAVNALISLAERGLHSYEDLNATTDYLIDHLRYWQRDESHVFGMYCALLRLSQRVRGLSAAFRRDMNAARMNRLTEAIEDFLPKMKRSLLDARHAEYKPIPRLEGDKPALAKPFFVPYGRFWRMKRSGFLMYLHLLIEEDGQKLVGPVQRDDILKKRIVDCIQELLRDVEVPYDRENPCQSLVRSHLEHGCAPGRRDWGLSAQLAALLSTDAIRSLLCQDDKAACDKYLAAGDALKQALLNTFDRYHDFPDVFHYTNAYSFSRCLFFIDSRANASEDVAALDHAIVELLGGGVTEASLGAFVSTHILRRAAGAPSQGMRPDKAADPIRDLLLVKLQFGEYTAEASLWPKGNWHALKKSTVDFYEGAYGDLYVEKYNAEPVINFSTRLEDMFKPRPLRGLKAIDVGCGPGQYAVLLKKQGFSVELYDESTKMLEHAARSLGMPSAPKPRDYFHLGDECGPASFDLVFASAMMVHVPRQFAPQIYAQFFRMLKPGGILFVNFKIGDHSLISTGGRYYQYYRDREAPWSMLRAAGFAIVEIIERWNHQTSCGLPREIRWVNFFCQKPDDNPDRIAVTGEAANDRADG